MNAPLTDRKATNFEVDFLRRMPKVELHVHLEGAISPSTIRTMAARNNVTLPVSEGELENFFKFRDFDHFLEAYYAATSTMLTLEDWRLMIDQFMADRREQNIVYSEVFVSASHHLQRYDHDEWIRVLSESIGEGEERYGVRIRLIPDISREVPETSRPVLDFVTKAWENGVALGIGLGGPEQGFPPELFTDVFAEAKQAGMHVVAHAGETEGAASVRGAWNGLGAERIGHGLRVLEDPDLTHDMAAARVPFEVNPTSNYCIGVVSQDSPHPIRGMIDSGLVVTVNSDDPALFGNSLAQEFQLLIEQGFELEELWKLNLDAIGASFLNETEKETLTQQFCVFHTENSGGR
ncbi:MAG: adenosine deaminase [Chthonomonas sp.]|nr:adenosine deaminase [Chthonomonas sp.]